MNSIFRGSGFVELSPKDTERPGVKKRTKNPDGSFWD
jgi:hypothetical protein